MPVKISRILHAGYIFEAGGHQIAFDPIFENPFSRNCYAFPAIQFDFEKIKKINFSAVFISHFHDDHCSLESLNLLDRQIPIYLYCIYDELFEMIRALGFNKVYPLDLNGVVQVGPFQVIPRKALDSEVDSMFQVKVDDLNILNVVDSWVHPDIYKLLEIQRPWDLILWPFQTMRELEVLSPLRAQAAPDELPDEWIIPLQILNPKFLVPSSCQFVHENWSWYNRALFPISYQKFQLKMKSILPRAEIIRMNPSVSFVLDKENMTSAAALDWIIPVGSQDVDYEYSPSLIPPSVQDISKNFEPLAKEESDKVYQYCQVGILEKYRSLQLAEEPYFHVERFWQLTVYDHEGKGFSFFYKIIGTDIEIAKDCESFVTWWTEVSIFKLYSALFLGESLTSMYLRLNNRFYDLDTEVELQSVEIICDPLIRCLFDGDFGSYQRDQLRRITENLNIKR